MEAVYAVASARTAIGSFQGALSAVPAVTLGATVVKAAIERAGVDPSVIDEVFFGGVLTAGLGQNVARQVSIGAGIPNAVPAATLSMVCGSGMRAILDGARAIASGTASVVVCGGTESMSQSAYASLATRSGARMGDTALIDTMIRDGLWDAFNDIHMGETAERICDQWGITREELDEFALASQLKCEAAQRSGAFDTEIVPVTVRTRKGEVIVDTDEGPRAGTTVEALKKLRPAFRREDGRVTAGNASSINDGAAALVLASESAVNERGLTPVAKLVSFGQGGVDPQIMGIGPVPASKQALERAGLEVSDLDLIESNEAFAAQSIAVGRELGFDADKLNVNGGAIALGHPIGASGARIVVTLLHALAVRDEAKLGLATLCVGGGMGVATVWEKA